MRPILFSGKTIMFSMAFMVFSYSPISAEPPEIITLDENDPSSGDQKYKAEKEVQMKDGYEYTSSGNETFLGFTTYDFAEYESLFTENDFENREIDENKPVGRITGRHNVTPTSGASYTIPIEVPPGTKGMAPEISITYNSQGSQGKLGSGWAVSGLSSINRAPNTKYHNGEVSPVNLDNSDNFVLNGSVLIPISGDNGENGTIYGPEAEDFSRVTSHGTSGDGPEWFELTSKNGVTIEFGNTSDSRFMDEDDNTVITWRINRMEDQFGNYVEFQYNNDYRQSTIDKILYTGNDDFGLNPYNIVDFQYDFRNDQNFDYVAGNEVRNNFVLNKIRIISESKHVKDYEFNYGENLHSYLKEVKKYGPEREEKLNSTIFKYGENVEDLTTTNFDEIFGERVDMYTGDFNGNGLTDFVVAEYDADYDGGELLYKDYMDYRLYLNNGDGTFDEVFSENLPNNRTTIQGEHFFSNYLRFQTIDHNFNGKNGFVMTETDLEVSTENLIFEDLYFYESTGNSFVENYSANYSTPSDYKYVNTTYFNISNFFHTGDFVGDGMYDFVKYLSKDGYYRAFLSTPNKNTPDFAQKNVQINNLQGTDNEAPDAVYVLDYTGDGKNELMETREGENTIIYSIHPDPNNPGEFKAKEILNTGYPSGWHDIFLGDFNGNGRSDIFTYNHDSDNWNIGYADDQGFDHSTFDFEDIQEDLHVNALQTLTLVDISGNGKTDIINPVTKENETIGVYYSKGDNEFEYQQYDEIKTMISTSGASLPYHLGDFFGDGKIDLFCYRNCHGADLLQFNKNGQDHLLTEVKDGYNNSVTFDYDILSQSEYYEKGDEASFPLIDINPAIDIVKGVSIQDGLGGRKSTTYEYGELVMHRQGKGMLGFQNSVQKNHTENIKTEREYEIYVDNEKFYQPYLKASQTYLLDENELLSTTEHEYEFDGLNNNQRLWQRNTESIEIDEVNDRMSHTTKEYDFNGNVTKRIQDIDGVENITTEWKNFETQGGTVPHLPGSKTVTRERGNKPPDTRSIEYEYSPKGMLLEEIAFPGEDKSITSTYQYNLYGNLVTEIKEASGLPYIIEKMEYDEKQRFVTEHENPLGQTKSFTYDNFFGKPTKIQDIHGHITNKKYDDLGRLKKVTGPEDVSKTISYHWDITGNNGSDITSLDNTLFYIKTEIDGRPEKKVWYDRLQRKRAVQTEGFNEPVFQVKDYNEMGQVVEKTVPFFEHNTNPVTTTYNYDKYNRISSKEKGELGATSIAYNSVNGGEIQTTVTKPDGETMITFEDAAGKKVKAEDHDGTTINYKYNSSGKKVEVEVDNEKVAKMEYDQYGRQTLLDDVNAGVSEYEYNAYGDLTYQKDGEGNEYTMTFDMNGRLIEREGPDGKTTFEYVESGNGLNQLSKKEGPNGNSVSFTYDQYGRPVEREELIDGQSFKFYMDYNKYGDKKEKVFPSGFKVEYSYDDNGYLEYITDEGGNKKVFELKKSNAFAQAVEFQQGETHTTDMVYDQYGLPEEVKVNHASNSDIMNMAFNFDAESGNLKRRQDQLNGITEEFEYDDLNRLREFKVTVGSYETINEVEFAPNGNITYKSDAGVGDFTYDNDRINAVTGVEDPVPELKFNQEIKYTYFNQTKSVEQEEWYLEFEYGPHRQRVMSELMYDDNDNGEHDVKHTTKYYAGSYEKIILHSDHPEHNTETIYEVHYINSSVLYVKENGTGEFYYTHTDHLGSILSVTDENGNTVAEQNFDPWGRYRDPGDWSYDDMLSNGNPAWLSRGFTGHEHHPRFGLINMNNRMYDPILGRMLSPDNYVQDPGYTQNYNRYSYAWNNPLVYEDPDGDFIVTAAIIGAGVFGVGNVAAQAIAGNIDDGWDVAKAFGTGAVAGGLIGAGVGAGIGATGLTATSRGLKVGINALGAIYGTTTAVSGLAGVANGVSTGDWSNLKNTGKIFLGNFYLDENREWYQQVLQGISRFTREILQTTAGYTVSQTRNMHGHVDHVEYFGGATFAIQENADTDRGRGIAMGNHIGGWVPGDFDGVINEPVLMHEYGHTFDSQIFGPGYALVIGPMSLYSASSRFSGNHRDQWYEQSANYHAQKYLEKHYDMDWGSQQHPHLPRYTVGERYPQSPVLRGSWLY